ncbi:MAG: type II toxin-antitoxin system VapC family toxin [Caldilineaceae bacterium]
MTIVAVADTHALIWYLYGDSRLSPRARQVFEDAANQGELITISSITLAGIVYLSEKGRIALTALQLILAELNSAVAMLTETPVDRSIISAMSSINRNNVPELPDRIIAGTAIHLQVPSISRDSKLQASPITTIW